jgi:hypothetical protein
MPKEKDTDDATEFVGPTLGEGDDASRPWGVDLGQSAGDAITVRQFRSRLEAESFKKAKIDAGHPKRVRLLGLENGKWREVKE